MGRVGVCSCIMRVLVLAVLLLAAVVHGHGQKHRRNKLKKNEPRCRVQTFLVHKRQYKTECHEVFERQCETVFRDQCNTITEFSEQCSHHYDAAHYIAPRVDDLHHHAAPAHHQQCVQVPHHREVCHKEPVQNCYKVPRQECRRVSVSVPRRVSRNICH